MNRIGLLVTGLLLSWGTHSLLACCAVSRPGKIVVNADQTVLMIWNPKIQMQHFIRQASFKSDANDVGFLVPSPSKPVLAETDRAVFGTLKKITERTFAFPGGAGGGNSFGGVARAPKPVEIIEQKRVAGYDATVLKADSGESLVEWLKNNQYDYSPAVAAWAKPYIEEKWFFTALKVAPKEDVAKPQSGDLQSPGLRISFKTEEPLFPYREPASGEGAKALTAKARILQIFFIAEGEYRGDLGKTESWSGRTVWSKPLAADDVNKLRDQLKLPPGQLPETPWLTEFVDNWAYDKAKSDLRFLPVALKDPLKLKEPIKIKRPLPLKSVNPLPLQKQINDQGREAVRKAQERLNAQPKP